MSDVNRLAYEIAAKDLVWPRLPILMADTQSGDIVYINEGVANTFGYSVDELIGKPVETLIPPDMRDNKDAEQSKERVSMLDMIRVLTDECQDERAALSAQHQAERLERDKQHREERIARDREHREDKRAMTEMLEKVRKRLSDMAAQNGSATRGPNK